MLPHIEVRAARGTVGGEERGGRLRVAVGEPRLQASSSGAASSGLARFCAPTVVVRPAPGGAEQKDPAPCVGHTPVSSGSSASDADGRFLWQPEADQQYQ